MAWKYINRHNEFLHQIQESVNGNKNCHLVKFHEKQDGYIGSRSSVCLLGLGYRWFINIDY